MRASHLSNLADLLIYGMGVNPEPHSLPWDELLKPGNHIMCSHMTAEPRALLASLASATVPEDLSIELGVPFSLDALALPDSVSLQVMGGMGSAGSIAKKREMIIDREEYLRIMQDYASGVRQADIVLASLAVDHNGKLHMGASHGPILEAARHAKQVIVEVNTAAPVINGAPWPNDIPITRQIDCHYAIAATEPSQKINAHEKQIAEHLAELIPNGACLQVGIGSLPVAILSSLSTHHSLGIHTGMLGDSLYKLVSQGIVDNSRKPIEFRKSFTGSVFGSAQLYGALANNSEVVLAPPTQTHALDALQQIRHLTTINSAIEVDLSGRVNTESVQGRDGTRRYVGGVGGLPAFVRGALAAKNGMSIIALPALTRYNEESNSRIVRSLPAEVTLDETMADIVVTEFGVARLRGASPAQRRERLIAIASPEARDWLRYNPALS